MFSELLAIISSNGMQIFHSRLKQVNHGITHQVGSASFDFPQQDQARFSLRQGYGGLAMPFPNNGVHFPIANPLAFLDDGWSLFNTHSVWQFSPTVIIAITFATFLLAAQMMIQRASSMFIR